MMTDDPTGPPPGAALRRATSGRSRLGVSLRDPRAWKAMIGEHGAAGGILAAAMVVAFALQYAAGGPETWGLSARALAEGRWGTLGSHVFAHANGYHLVANLGALTALSALVMARFGRGVGAWLRFAALFAASALASAALFLALNPFGAVPMVGASGAICGLWGAVARVGPDGALVPLRSGQVGDTAWAFVESNILLFVPLFLLAQLMGLPGGLAWEAHLGGFLLGLFAMPWLAPERRPAPGGAAVPAGT